MKGKRKYTEIVKKTERLRRGREKIQTDIETQIH